MNLVDQVDLKVGRYVSKEWVQKKILRFTEDEINEMEKQIAKEPPPVDPNDPNQQ